MPQQTWPEGVIARYLTVGGAHVDVAEDPIGAFLSCSGCTWVSSITAEETPNGTVEHAYVYGRHKAQSHAESCRAMPKPGGERS